MKKLLVIVCCWSAAGALHHPGGGRRQQKRAALTMRDSSSVTWLAKGDRVRVVVPMVVKGFELLGKEGTCIDVWEKCEEDPHCCCAELAEESAAVTVKFSPELNNMTYYFAEDELERVKGHIASSLAVGLASTPGIAAASEGLSKTNDDKLVAVALVLPLLSYKVAASVNNQRLLPVLDFAILAAVLSAFSFLVAR